jgi:hypothetical protein
MATLCERLREMKTDARGGECGLAGARADVTGTLTFRNALEPIRGEEGGELVSENVSAN